MKKKRKNIVAKWRKEDDGFQIYEITLLLHIAGIVVKKPLINVLAIFLLEHDLSITNAYSLCFGKEHDDQIKKGNDFSEKMKGNPKYFKFLFKYAHFNTDQVPVIAIKYIYTTAVINVVFDSVLLGLMICKSGVLGIMTAPFDEVLILLVMVYSIIFIFRSLFLGLRAFEAVFIDKFKKVTWRNVKYLLWRVLFTEPHENEPSYSVLGTCSVISVRKKGRKKYADVRMIRDGVVYRNVLMQGDEKINSVKWLQEICKVKYVN